VIADLVIVTDLDGTLLDARDYSRAAADATLARLCREGVPVVICSSKTRAEIERCRRDAGLGHPFISENGGALFVPQGYFPFDVGASRVVPGHDVIEFGWPYGRVIDAVHRAAAESGARVTGFSDLSVTHLARICGLSLRDAHLALQREYDEPFQVLDGRVAGRYRFYRALRRNGLQCCCGGRFDHAHGGPGKGQAVAVLRRLYERAAGHAVLLAGLGDAPNDVSLLKAVDVPIVVPGETWGRTARLLRKVPGARLAPASGPRGWASAVREVLRGPVARPAVVPAS
jgi:mannosyl-3-phosphoglycerate phosphatase